LKNNISKNFKKLNKKLKKFKNNAAFKEKELLNHNKLYFIKRKNSKIYKIAMKK